MEEALRAVRTTLNDHFSQNRNAECECIHHLKPEHFPFRDELKKILEAECDYQEVEFPTEDTMRISWYWDGHSDRESEDED